MKILISIILVLSLNNQLYAMQKQTPQDKNEMQSFKKLDLSEIIGWYEKFQESYQEDAQVLVANFLDQMSYVTTLLNCFEKSTNKFAIYDELEKKYYATGIDLKGSFHRAKDLLIRHLNLMSMRISLSKQKSTLKSAIIMPPLLLEKTPDIEIYRLATKDLKELTCQFNQKLLILKQDKKFQGNWVQHILNNFIQETVQFITSIPQTTEYKSNSSNQQFLDLTEEKINKKPTMNMSIPSNTK